MSAPRIVDRDHFLDRIAEVRAGTSARQVAYPIKIREVEVVRSRMVGGGLVRVTFGGPGTAGFESHAQDEHVRLVFPGPDGVLRLPEQNGFMLSWPTPFPTTRKYTVRRYDPVTGELDLDFALHGAGVAADWARAAEPGMTVHVAGPPGGLIVPHAYDRYLLAGDLTALPAIARWLEELPREAAGWAFVEVAADSERIDLAAPEAVDVHWLRPGELAAAVRAVEIADGERVFAWMAGEAGDLRPLRRWVREDLKLAADDHDITGYWKRGAADYDDDHDH
ncbi:siderophore-interacting protein [Nonomuraea sp. NBC_01738]|uniref:siderophore-interacting protein n=1 Tax=Nonomuraea sp. NBC_01738 TaxID=2976003 RepID=UPI002E0F15ED|nr:siderophore-interacting protein [Nonomuraea sp. NBC_01738]